MKPGLVWLNSVRNEKRPKQAPSASALIVSAPFSKPERANAPISAAERPRVRSGGLGRIEDGYGQTSVKIATHSALLNLARRPHYLAENGVLVTALRRTPLLGRSADLGFS